MSLRCIKPTCGGDGQVPCPDLPTQLNPTQTGCLPYHNLRSIDLTPVCAICHKFRDDLALGLRSLTGETTSDIYSRCDDFQYGCGYATHEALGRDLQPLMVNPVISDVCIAPGTEALFGATTETPVTWPNYWGCQADCVRLDEQCNAPDWLKPQCCTGYGKCTKVGRVEGWGGLINRSLPHPTTPNPSALCRPATSLTPSAHACPAARLPRLPAATLLAASTSAVAAMAPVLPGWALPSASRPPRAPCSATTTANASASASLRSARLRPRRPPSPRPPTSCPPATTARAARSASSVAATTGRARPAARA